MASRTAAAMASRTSGRTSRSASCELLRYIGSMVTEGMVACTQRLSRRMVPSFGTVYGFSRCSSAALIRSAKGWLSSFGYSTTDPFADGSVQELPWMLMKSRAWAAIAVSIRGLMSRYSSRSRVITTWTRSRWSRVRTLRAVSSA